MQLILLILEEEGLRSVTRIARRYFTAYLDLGWAGRVAAVVRSLLYCTTLCSRSRCLCLC